MAQSFKSKFATDDSYHSDSLSTWLFIAAVVHAIILLGVTFAAPDVKKVSKAIEITLVSSATRKAPDDAKYLAQENQIGAGQETQKPKPNEQKIPKIGKKKKKQGKIKQPKKKKSSSKAKSKKKKSSSHRVISQKKQKKKKKQKVAKTKKIAQKKSNEPAELSMAALEQQIAQLGDRVKYLKKSSEKTNIKFVNSISAHKYVAAQYVRDWERKVQRIGNLNYPKIAREKGFHGTLSMDVGIRTNGSIYQIRIVKSSGNKVLDDAAKRIVRMSAPFAALPKQISKQLEVLIIRRSWSFTDEAGLNL
ncbi:MAG: TonB family protein [Methylococcaceae bacterium]|nr:TonB family protein [Methylococcaceae bacterium]